MPAAEFGRVPQFDDDWGQEFMAAIDAYMTVLWESVEDPSMEIETLSGQPFDGCETCEFRERNLMAVKLTIEGYEAGRVRLG